MKIDIGYSLVIAVMAIGVGCSQSSKSPDVAGTIRKSLDQAGYKDVSVSQDRDKGVVTLSGHVATEAEKAQAEALAKPYAAGQVVSDQIAVIPPGAENEAKTIHSDLDAGIEKNLHAALVQHRLQKDIKYDVKNGVVTLSGDVNTPAARAQVATVAAAVPNVAQVVNELEVKHQKATSSQ